MINKKSPLNVNYPSAEMMRLTKKSLVVFTVMSTYAKKFNNDHGS